MLRWWEENRERLFGKFFKSLQSGTQSVYRCFEFYDSEQKDKLPIKVIMKFSIRAVGTLANCRLSLGSNS